MLFNIGDFCRCTRIIYTPDKLMCFFLKTLQTLVMCDVFENVVKNNIKNYFDNML